VPLLDVIPFPADDDWALLVMPVLLEFQKLPFRRLGEFCEAAFQYIQVRITIGPGGKALRLSNRVDNFSGAGIFA
jgi:hypothetical protein